MYLITHLFDTFLTLSCSLDRNLNDTCSLVSISQIRMSFYDLSMQVLLLDTATEHIILLYGALNNIFY